MILIISTIIILIVIIMVITIVYYEIVGSRFATCSGNFFSM
jgi:hypothetical protein